MQERSKQRAFDTYVQMVEILNDENWTQEDPRLLEQALGRPVVRKTTDNSDFGAAYRTFGEAIVDVIAEALQAGVTQKDLTTWRGWLSHSDIRGYIFRASKPSSYDYQPNWPQRATLAAVLRDVDRMRGAGDEHGADALLRSARSFLRRWSRQIPVEPSTESLDQTATVWRGEHLRLWKQARAKFLLEVDESTRPKYHS